MLVLSPLSSDVGNPRDIGGVQYANCASGSVCDHDFVPSGLGRRPCGPPPTRMVAVTFMANLSITLTVPSSPLLVYAVDPSGQDHYMSRAPSASSAPAVHC